MTERVKARSSTFLACYIAIATAFVLVDGSGWWLKKKEKKHRKEQECEERWGGKRDFGQLLSLGTARAVTLAANVRPRGFSTSRSWRSESEQLLSV